LPCGVESFRDVRERSGEGRGSGLGPTPRPAADPDAEAGDPRVLRSEREKDVGPYVARGARPAFELGRQRRGRRDLLREVGLLPVFELLDFGDLRFELAGHGMDERGKAAGVRPHGGQRALQIRDLLGERLLGHGLLLS
jgi:hypothetical protein